MNDAQMAKFRKKTARAADAKACLNAIRKLEEWLVRTHYQPLGTRKGMVKVEKELDAFSMKITKLAEVKEKYAALKIWNNIHMHVLNWNT